MTTPPSVASVATKIFEELSKLEGEERKRALNGALAMLGEPVAGDRKGQQHQEEEASDDAAVTVVPKAKLWMRSNKLSGEELGNVFHVEGNSADLIASAVPGGTKTKQTMNVYLLMGSKGLLETGEAKFDDKAARKQCERMGCYDGPNHAGIIKSERSNYLNGSKEAGWSLTGPGQKAAAELIKDMAAA